MNATLVWPSILAVLLAAAPAARAQGGLSLTLEDAIARGIAHAPRLTDADARQAAAEATVQSRAAAERPVLTALAGVLRTNHVDEFGLPQSNGTTRVIFPDIPNNYRVRAELGMPLYTGGRVDALVSSARADVTAAAADRRGAAADVALDVAVAYWTLVTSRDRVGVLERSLERADAALSDARARVDSGLAAPNEVLSTQAQRARQNVQLIQARNDAALAEAQLARLVGAEPGEAIRATTPVDRPTPAAVTLEAASLGDLRVQAAGARPERAALLARQASFMAAATAAGATMRPQVAAVAAVEPARPNQRFVPRVDEWNTSWDVGVNVTWSLWDGGRSRADRAAASAQARAVGARLQDFDEAVGLETRQRVLDLESTRAAIAASAEAVAASTEARRVVGERVSAGVATSTEMLDSDVALLEAELEQSRLQAALRVAEARLLRTVGAQP
ncbi:MAG: TolC family protein [Acidobacteriota bacterium]